MRRRRLLFPLREPAPAHWRPVLLVLMPLLLLAAWFVASDVLHVNQTILPSPKQTVRGLLEMWFHYDLGKAMLVSGKRILIAVGMSVAVALPLGVLMGSFDAVFRLFDPIIAPLRYMPISAFIPLMLFWFGIEETQKIAFLFLGTFVYLLPAVVDAIRVVPDELVQTAATLGASRWRIIWTVLVPAALPSIFDSFRTLNAIAWTYVILAEVVNPNQGLGELFMAAYRTTKPAWSIAGLAVVGLIGLLSDRAIDGVNRLLFRWRD